MHPGIVYPIGSREGRSQTIPPLPYNRLYINPSRDPLNQDNARAERVGSLVTLTQARLKLLSRASHNTHGNLYTPEDEIYQQLEGSPYTLGRAASLKIHGL